MIRQILTMVKAVFSDQKLISYGLLLLILHLLGLVHLYKIVPEYDFVTHFLFGFTISACVSKAAISIALHESLAKKLNGHGWATNNPRRLDFIIRLFGFFLIGGLLWESAELVFSPLVWRSADPFFTLPITMYNIDGALDVTIGAIGAMLAWCIERKTLKI